MKTDKKRAVEMLKKGTGKIMIGLMCEKQVLLDMKEEGIEFDDAGMYSSDEFNKIFVRAAILYKSEKMTGCIDVGHVHFYFIEKFADTFKNEMLINIGDDDDFYDFCIAISDKNLNIKPCYCEPGENLIFIYELYVKPKYRGYGIGKFIAKNLPEMFNRTFFLETAACAVSTEPMDGEGGMIECMKDNAEKQKINKEIFKTCGYRAIPESDFMFLRCKK